MDVIVIGAGIAGLRAAVDLSARGARVREVRGVRGVREVRGVRRVPSVTRRMWS